MLQIHSYNNLQLHLVERCTIIGGSFKKKAPIVVFEKRINGSYYVVEAVSDAKSKKNYVVSAYKTKAANQSLDARASQDTSENAAENTAFVNDSISNLSENVNANQKKRS